MRGWLLVLGACAASPTVIANHRPATAVEPVATARAESPYAGCDDTGCPLWTDWSPDSNGYVQVATPDHLRDNQLLRGLERNVATRHRKAAAVHVFSP